jgi:AcrR family transcriptional regulator
MSEGLRVPLQSIQRTYSRRKRGSLRKSDSRRERKKQETRQRLLGSAWELFQEQGYDHTTVEDITDAADVAKGTFFNYFETKQALLDEVALWRIDALGQNVLAGGDVPQSAIARIKLVIAAMAEEFSPERELTRRLFMARISAPIKRESAHRLGSLIHVMVRQGQEQGEIRDDVDAALIARLLMTCFFHSFCWWHHHDGDGRPTAATPQQALPCEGTQETASGQDTGQRARIGDDPRLMGLIDALMDGLGGPERRTV